MEEKQTKKISPSGMKFGITEGGDASVNFQWIKALEEDTELAGSIIITKCLSHAMINPILQFRNKIILHVSVTGYAGTDIEPNTPAPEKIYDTLAELLGHGFPAKQVVLRIDPVIPTPRGLKRARMIFDMFSPLVSRVRVSMLDMYPAVQKRFEKVGLPNPYGSNHFQPSEKMADAMMAELESWHHKNPNVSIECCAEPLLAKPFISHVGCVSKRDYEILGIPAPEDENPNRKRQRQTCTCLHTKKELLGEKCRCPNQCLYCYWRDMTPESYLDQDEFLIN